MKINVTQELLNKYASDLECDDCKKMFKSLLMVKGGSICDGCLDLRKKKGTFEEEKESPLSKEFKFRIFNYGYSLGVADGEQSNIIAQYLCGELDWVIEARTVWNYLEIEELFCQGTIDGAEEDTSKLDLLRFEAIEEMSIKGKDTKLIRAGTKYAPLKKGN